VAVTVNKGIDPLTDPREIPRSRWSELVAARKYHCLGNIPADCRTLLHIVSDAEGCDWLGYGSRERYMREGLDLDPGAVDLAIGFLRAADLDVPIEFSKAVESGRKLAAHGGDRKSSKVKEENQGDNVTLIDRGNSTGYLAARLARDAPDVLERLEAGEFKSVRAAAKAAGIVKDPAPIAQLRKWWARATDEERQEFLSWACS